MVFQVDLLKVLPCLGQRGPKFANLRGLRVAIANCSQSSGLLRMIVVDELVGGVI